MFWISSRDAYVDFISMVVVCAPDDFFVEDFLPAEEQLDLEKAFQELYEGMKFLDVARANQQRITDLRSMLTSSLAAYRAGDTRMGAHLLQDFERSLLAAF